MNPLNHKTPGIVLLFLFFCVPVAFAQKSKEAKPLEASLEAYIEQGRKQWDTPGLAVAVVKDGQVVFQKGFGVRRLGEGPAVDENTLFAMCSTTKAVTAAAVAILVDRGKLKWDDRVVDHMPGFQLSDPYITRDLRVRDLLTHNAGPGNTDLLWYNSDYDQQQILARMRHAPMAYPLRGGYTYQNVMYLAAGALIEKASGKRWADFISEELFGPIGMSRSYPLQQRIPAGEKNRSNAHYYVDGKVAPIPDIDIDPIAPAGAAWSTVADLTKWMRFLLDSARVNGRRLISAESFAELFKPQIIVPGDQFYPTIQLTKPTWTTYGLGWFQQDYNGRAVSYHTGSIDGTVAICGLMPSERLGVYVFGNLDHTELRHAIMFKVFDLYTGVTNGRDWSTAFRQLYDGIAARQKEAQKKQEAARVAGAGPSHPLQAYTGVYSDPLYGDLTVSLAGDKLSLRLSSKTTLTLEHWHYDTFLGRSNHFWHEPDQVVFEVDGDGQIGAVKIFGSRFGRKPENP